MMFDVSVKISGIKHVDRRLEQFEPKIQRGIIRKAARRAAKPVLQRSVANAPRQTGLLKKGLKIRAIKRTRKAVGVRVNIDKQNFRDQYYGSFVELGTKYQRAQRYMRDAMEQAKMSSRAIWITEVVSLIKEAAK